MGDFNLTTGLLLLLLIAAVRADEVTRPVCNTGQVSYNTRTPSPRDTNATALILNSCGLEKLELAFFDGLPNLKQITIRWNNLEDINLAVFRPVPNITDLDLAFNKIREIPNFSEYPFPLLKLLFLQDNRITAIRNPNTFSGMQLQVLYLAGNLIEYIHPEVFKPLKLKELYLHENKITIISETMFQIKSLKMLTLDHNLLEYVPTGAFLGAELDRLRVDYNKLTHLPENFASDLVRSGARLESLRFCYNPWSCACLIEQVLEVKRLGVKDYDIYWDRQLVGTKPACVFDGRSCRRAPYTPSS